MIRKGLLATSAVALTLFAFSPALAQEDEDEAPRPKKKKTVEREKAPSVVGRNDALRDAFKDVAAKTAGRVVKVGSGYGIIVGKYVVTTSVAAQGGHVRVSGSAGSGEARVVGVDEANGIALLECPFEAKGFELAKHEPRIGQFVVTVGTDRDRPLVCGVLSAKNRSVEPRDLSQANLLMGLFSDGIDGPKRAYPKVLQHDAPMSDDILGSPLVDSEGTLVGINVGTGYRGSSYALAANDLMASIEAMKSGKVAPPSEPKRPEKRPAKEPEADRPIAPDARPYLGASVKETPEGLVVDELSEGGPAEKSGLQVGDRIATFGGDKVASLDELAVKIGKRAAGESVDVEVVRAGKAKKLTVKLGAR